MQSHILKNTRHTWEQTHRHRRTQTRRQTHGHSVRHREKGRERDTKTNNQSDIRLDADTGSRILSHLPYNTDSFTHTNTNTNTNTRHTSWHVSSEPFGSSYPRFSSTLSKSGLRSVARGSFSVSKTVHHSMRSVRFIRWDLFSVIRGPC